MEENRIIERSELIINPNGSIYHLNLLPTQIADTIILVGDPGRVNLVSSFFDHIELEAGNREFLTHTGLYRNKRISVLSTGIGTDNIDIVVNELDALVNIDLETRTIKKEFKSLNLIRIGTSGGLQEDIPVDSFLISTHALGFDGLLNFYQHREFVSDKDFERAFMKHVGWNSSLPVPYFVPASEELINQLSGKNMLYGITVTAPGFYGPQGRTLRLNPVDPEINSKLSSFAFQDRRITNYEMESSALFGLSALLGHKAVTVCAIIANRASRQYSKDYHSVIKKLILTVLNRITGDAEK